MLGAFKTVIRMDIFTQMDAFREKRGMPSKEGKQAALRIYKFSTLPQSLILIFVYLIPTIKTDTNFQWMITFHSECLSPCLKIHYVGD